MDVLNSELTEKPHRVLDSAVDKFGGNLPSRDVISGHAGKRATQEYNLALGLQRASAVADYMIAKGHRPLDNL